MSLSFIIAAVSVMYGTLNAVTVPKFLHSQGAEIDGIPAMGRQYGSYYTQLPDTTSDYGTLSYNTYTTSVVRSTTEFPTTTDTFITASTKAEDCEDEKKLVDKLRKEMDDLESLILEIHEETNALLASLNRAAAEVRLSRAAKERDPTDENIRKYHEALEKHFDINVKFWNKFHELRIAGNDYEKKKREWEDAKRKLAECEEMNGKKDTGN